MNSAEAQALFAELRSAYPAANVDAETLRIYKRELKPMNFELAQEAVRSALLVCKFLPAVAELHHHYAIAREQKRRKDEAEKRRLERIAEDNLPRVPLKDIPGVQEHLAKIRDGDVTALTNLEEVSKGKCDDCAKDGRRFACAHLALCVGCVTNRLRASQKFSAIASAKRLTEFAPEPTATAQAVASQDEVIEGTA